MKYIFTFLWKDFSYFSNENIFSPSMPLLCLGSFSQTQAVVSVVVGVSAAHGHNPMTGVCHDKMYGISPTTERTRINSLAPVRYEWTFWEVIFKLMFVIDGWGISCEIAPTVNVIGLTDDKSTLVQVMAWCRQTASLYLNQGWPRSMLPYGITRPQWVHSGSTGLLLCLWLSNVLMWEDFTCVCLLSLAETLFNHR